MAVKAPASAGRSFVPAARTRSAIAKRLAAQAGRMSTAGGAEMEIRHPWYSDLSAEERSWVSMVANEGINGFVDWFADDAESDLDPARIFNVFSVPLW